MIFVWKRILRLLCNIKEKITTILHNILKNMLYFRNAPAKLAHNLST